MLERTRQREYLRKVRLVIGMHPDPSVGRQGTSKLRLHANHRFEIPKMTHETFNLITPLKFWGHPQRSLNLISQLALPAEDDTSVSVHTQLLTQISLHAIRHMMFCTTPLKHTSSGFSPSTCLAWGTLPVAQISLNYL